jgi:hypothetical protein
MPPGNLCWAFDVFQGGEHSPKSVLYVSIMLKRKRQVKKSTMDEEVLHESSDEYTVHHSAQPVTVPCRWPPGHESNGWLSAHARRLNNGK